MKTFARACFACAVGMFGGAFFIAGAPGANMAVTLGMTFLSLGLFAMTMR